MPIQIRRKMMSSNKSLIDTILDLDIVESVQHFRYTKVPESGFTLLPFLCPFRYKPFNVVKNEQGVIIGVTTGYRDGITEGSNQRLIGSEPFGMAVLPVFWVILEFDSLWETVMYMLALVFFLTRQFLREVEDFEVVSNKQVWEKQGAVLELEKLCDDWYGIYTLTIQDVIKQERDEHLYVDGTMYHADGA